MRRRHQYQKNAKLTEADVVRIRALRRASATGYAQIAALYGVKTETIARVCRRETWAHVPDYPKES